MAENKNQQGQKKKVKDQSVGQLASAGRRKGDKKKQQKKQTEDWALLSTRTKEEKSPKKPSDWSIL